MQTGTLEADVAQLGNLGLAELRTFWAERLGTARQLASTELTRRWLAWELQAAARDGLDANSRGEHKSIQTDHVQFQQIGVNAEPGRDLAHQGDLRAPRCAGGPARRSPAFSV